MQAAKQWIGLGMNRGDLRAASRKQRLEQASPGSMHRVVDYLDAGAADGSQVDHP
jgi:hypothetical protein